MGSLYRFKMQLSEYLSRNTNPNVNLIKFEANNENADIIFIKSLNIWDNYIEIDDADRYGDNILLYALENGPKDEHHGVENFKRTSEKFEFPIQEIKILDNKCLVQLSRAAVFKTMLLSILSSDYGKQAKSDKTLGIAVSELENSSITNFRLNTIALTLKNLTEYSSYTMTNDYSTADYKIMLTTRSNFKKNDSMLDSSFIILCSVVRENNENCKKMSHLSAEEYIKKRMDDMHLIALHKYGVRIKSDDKFLELREKLGKAACKLDMIEVKHSNALTLKFDSKQAFILYNSARIETLLKSFDERVSSGYYPKLPQLDDIDINLLTSDEEWRLLKQLMLFPETVQNAFGDFKAGRINVHLLYKYLYNLAIEFSNYYSKKKILTENRTSLIDRMHAKIYLLKSVQKVFKNLLQILDIEPVSSM